MFNSAVVIYSRNSGIELVNYVNSLASFGVKKIIIADDGSTGENVNCLNELQSMPQCDVLPSGEEKGIGVALKQALWHYKESSYFEEYNGLVYLEYLGRYTKEDIFLVSEKMTECPDKLIVTQRNFADDIHKKKKTGNKIAKIIYGFLYGVKMFDTQSGLRGIPNAIIYALIETPGERYDYFHNMILEGNRTGVENVVLDLESVSTDEMVVTNVCPVKNEKKMYFKLMRHFIKYIISTLTAFAIDMLLFTLFVSLWKNDAIPKLYYIMPATLCARGCSSVYTYIINRFFVFQSHEDVGRSLRRYYLLVAVQILISGVLVTLVCELLHLGDVESLIYCVVNILVFFISFKLEKMVIFK